MALPSGTTRPLPIAVYLRSLNFELTRPLLHFVLWGAALIATYPSYTSAQKSPRTPGSRSSAAAAQSLPTNATLIGELAFHPQWLALGHYRESLFGFYRSEIDDAEFFLSPEGKDDPKAELLATLSSNSQDIACRFPARLHWLEKRLGKEKTSCPELNQWMENLEATGATLVFPGAFLNNPASAFGHTLLRIDNPGPGFAAASINFSASVPTVENAILYALKGLFGGYRGYFSVAPYYEHLETYSDREHRDIWEYPLQLEDKELALMLEHVWELQNIPLNYYYLDENCSYHLLSLIEVATGKELRNKFHLWAIPIDTIRAIGELDSPSVLGEPAFRPSQEALVAHLEKKALPAVKNAVKRSINQVSTEPLAKLTGEQPYNKLLAYDLAYEVFAYKHLPFTQVSKDTTHLRQYAASLLKERSKIHNSQQQQLSIEAPSRPDKSHSSARLSLGSNFGGSRSIFLLDYRPALHDFLDPTAGYNPGALLEVLPLSLGLRDKGRTRVEEVGLVKASSIVPRGDFTKPISWEMALSARRKQVSDNEPLVYQTKVGAGFSSSLPKFTKWNSLVSLLGGLALEHSGYYRDNYALGTSVSILARLPQTQLQLRATGTRFFSGQEHSAFKMGISKGFELSSSTSIYFSINREQGVNRRRTTGEVGLGFYF